MFAEAVRDRLIPSSPFADVRPGRDVNWSRDHDVDRATALAILESCCDCDWRLIFVLARFGGLRRCEILTLTWADILWDSGKLKINSPKTGLRHCPIFAEFKPILEAAFDAAPEGSVRCLSRYRVRANLGPQLNRIIEAAGVKPWDKPLQNLRSSRRTELQERFPGHVINQWLDHSNAVAAKHYLQVTQEQWEKGASELTGTAVFWAVSSVQISTNQEPSMTRKNPQKTP